MALRQFGGKVRGGDPVFLNDCRYVFRIGVGKSNVAAHESDDIFRMIAEAGFEICGEKQFIETSVGTLAIVVFKLVKD